MLAQDGPSCNQVTNLPKGVEKMRIVVLLLLKRARLALFGIYILTLYNPKSSLWISFPLWLVCVEHHRAYSCGLGFG